MKSDTPFRRFNYEIKPTKVQQILINQIMDDCRRVRNLMINNLQQRFGEVPEYKYKDLLKGEVISKELPTLKEAHPYLKRSSSKAIQMNVLDLGKAYKNYFDRNYTKNGSLKVEKKDIKKGLPKFKSYKSQQSFGLTKESFKLKGKDLYILPRTFKSPIKVFWSRDLPEYPSSVTIIKTVTNRYYVSFVVNYEEVLESGEGIVGIDVGSKTYATTSNPEDKPIENPQWLERKLVKLRHLQQKLARAVKGSNNWKKIKLKIAKVHEKIKNQRSDYQFKNVKGLIKKYKTIVVETLDIKTMIVKAKKAGNKVLARKIADASWGSFFNILKDKMNKAPNGQLVWADKRFPSTQLCSKCNKYSEVKLELKDRVFSCKCGNKLDRDFNAALNLKKMAEIYFKHQPIFKYTKVVQAPIYKELLMFPEYS